MAVLISVTEIVRAVLMRWPLILAGTIIAAVLSFGATAFVRAQFEAKAVVMASTPKLREQPSVSPNTQSFRALLLSQTVATQVVRQLGTPNMTDEHFLTQVVSVNEIPGTPLLRITVRLPDAQLAAKAANLVAERGIELTRRLNQEEVLQTRDYLKAQLDEQAAKMADAEARLLEFKRGAQMDLLEADTRAMLRQREDLLSLVVDIAAERARLLRAEGELAKQERLLQVRRSPSTSAALIGAAAEEEGRSNPSPEQGNNVLTGLNLHEPTLNPVFEALSYQVASTRSRLAALEQRREELTGARGLDANKLDKLTELYQKEIARAALEAELDLSQRVYYDLATRYEESRVQVASQTPQLQIVDRAMPPTQPLPSRRIFIVCVATIAGALISVSLIFFWSLAAIPQLRA